MITDLILSTLLSNVTLLLYSLSLTIKKEQTFGTSSIHTESRLSKEKKHFSSDKFAPNQ